MKTLFRASMLMAFSGLLLLSNQSFVQAQSNPYVKITIPGLSCSQSVEKIEWGDYDNDGDMDIYEISRDTSNNVYTLKIYENTNNIFLNTHTFSSPTNPEPHKPFKSDISNVGIADLNNDGYLDIYFNVTLSVVGYANWVYIFQNSASGQFSWIDNTQYHHTQALGYGYFQDADRDGDLDFYYDRKDQAFGFYGAIQNTLNNHTSVQLYQSSTVRGIYDSYREYFFDIDNDGDLDVVENKFSPGSLDTTAIFRNNGDGTHSLASYIDHESYYKLIDYDNDGDLDMIAGGTSHAIIYQNNGSGAFAKLTNSSLATAYNYSFLAGDYDNDGDVDILDIENDSIFDNNGSGNFTRQSYRILGAEGFVDFDGDGDLDIYTHGNEIYVNTTVSKNVKPTAPTPVANVINNHRVKLSWNQSSDDHTSNQALTYNVYIKQGSQYIVSPESIESTGYRMVNKDGNAEFSLAYTINGLSAGTYTWAVQAVDQSGIASPFSTPQTFTIVPTVCLSGKNRIDPDFMEKGIVHLYRLADEQEHELVATYEVEEGTEGEFFFCDVAPGMYKIETIPDPEMYPEHAHGYFVDAVNLEEAEVIFVEGEDIEGLEIILHNYGNYRTASDIESNTTDGNIMVYPNPTASEFTLNINDQLKGKYEVQVFDLQGKEVLKTSFEKQRIPLEKKLSIQTLQSGMYVVKVTSEKAQRSFKILKVEE